MHHRSILRFHLVMLAVVCSGVVYAGVVIRQCAAADSATREAAPPSAAQRAQHALMQGKLDDALQWAEEAVQEEPQDVAARLLRASVYDALRRHPKAIEDYGFLLRQVPDAARIYHLRGRSRFKTGDIAGSMEDFNRAARLDPRLEKRLWERGISCYYAGKFTDGARQFELYQEYDASDVENVVWRFLCQARVNGFPSAQQNMMSLDREDPRVPLMTVYALYRGTASPEDVLAAAGAGEPDEKELRQRLFYAHLYLALYFEAKSEADAAREHMLLAESQQISHYMWDVAHVHVKQRDWSAQATR